MIIIETCPECGHELLNVMICTYPPIPKKECLNCGWSWEGKPEEIIRVPFGGNEEKIELNEIHTIREWPMQPSDAGFESSACKYCSNNPANGGSGICHCIIGLQPVYC